MRLVFLVFFYLLALDSSVAQIPQAEEIDPVFEKWNSTENPGAALAIIKNGETIYEKSYGLANLEHDIPINRNTVFNVGSVTKTITATCIMLLVKEGKMKMEDRLSLYFPQLPDYTKEITVQQLLNHTSGLRDYLVLHALTPNGIKYERDALNDEDILSIIKRQQGLDFPPNTNYSYSNTGYWLLGKIVQQISNLTLTEYAKKNIFTPLNMSETQIRDDKWVIIKNRASGYWVDSEGNWLFDGAHTQVVGPSGLYTSLSDMEKWHDAFYRNQFFDKEMVAEMTNKSMLSNGQTINSGMGVEIGSYKDGIAYGHRGASFGFKAIHWYYPKYDLGVIILANRHDAFGMQQRADKIANLVMGSSAENSTPKLNFQEFSLTEDQQKKFEGLYWNESEFLDRNIKYENDTLWYLSTRRTKYYLKPIGENSFTFLDGKIVSFEKNEGGYRMIVENKGRDLIFHSYKQAIYSEEECNEYVGAFYAKELGSTIKLFMKDEKIGWSIENKSYQDFLKPIMKDFFLVGGSTVFEFKRDTSGAVIGFYYRNTRANGLYFERR